MQFIIQHVIMIDLTLFVNNQMDIFFFFFFFFLLTSKGKKISSKAYTYTFSTQVNPICMTSITTFTIQYFI